MTPQTKARIVAAVAFPLLLMHGTPSLAAPAPHAAAAPTRFSVVVEGRGPDVILIPGLSSTRDVWTATAERLKVNHRVHLVQLKGFGEPAGANASGPVLQPFVDDLAAYIRAAHLTKPAIVGHSMGGLAALMLGAQHPELPGRLMIVDSFAFIGPVFGAPDVATITPRATQMRAMLAGNADKMTPNFTTAADCPATLPVPATPAGNMSNSGVGACMMKHGAMASDLRVVAQAMYDDMITDVRPQLGRIAAPVTLLYPQDDRLGSDAEIRPIYEASYQGTKQLKLVRIPGSYHFIMQDQPTLFGAALDAFLKN